jgi:hypothetical protein
MSLELYQSDEQRKVQLEWENLLSSICQSSASAMTSQLSPSRYLQQHDACQTGAAIWTESQQYEVYYLRKKMIKVKTYLDQPLLQ